MAPTWADPGLLVGAFLEERVDYSHGFSSVFLKKFSIHPNSPKQFYKSSSISAMSYLTIYILLFNSKVVSFDNNTAHTGFNAHRKYRISDMICKPNITFLGEFYYVTKGFLWIFWLKPDITNTRYNVYRI